MVLRGSLLPLKARKRQGKKAFQIGARPRAGLGPGRQRQASRKKMAGSAYAQLLRFLWLQVFPLRLSRVRFNDYL